ncbi:phosphofructokinase-domain-containing protein [Geranomyces variabilis]|nr:phosphofructokinase-domain-containing protein [Geranomyces variabilis]KAJ3137409.1 6-phosphofructokinase, alpha subunit [Geranomyces variabilis]
MATISALSHLTVLARSAALHDATLRFYAALGFTTVAVPSADGSDTWLHLFPAATDTKPDASADAAPAGVTLRVVRDIDPTFDEAEFRQLAEKKNAELKANENCTPHSAGSSSCFVVSDVSAIQAQLEKLNHPFSTAHAGKVQATVTSPKFANLSAGVALCTYDPVGNLLLFTDHTTPFGTSRRQQAALPKPVAAAALSSRALPQSAPQSVAASLNDLSDANATPPERKKRIGILTSGGDSSGMNAAVRSITRVALQKACIPYAIYEGYQGLVDGGQYIKELGWEDVRGLLSVGGTSIGTARCSDFRQREGRLRGAYNLISNGIDALVVIGGDGSLTGADMLRAEWSGLVDELIATNRVKAEECEHLREDLTIVGLVGSIDNDMAMTDITIGAVTSLHRICEAVDNLTSTALSHQRAFVIEVMGRHCGWLGLMAGIAVGADWVFLPERPPPLNDSKYGDDWETEMCDIVKKYRALGNRKTLVIVCEGAIDRNLKPIKSDYVQKVLTDRLHLDTRVTCLGHVQRGGTACAYDRFLATVQGVEAVEAVLRSKPGVPAPMIGNSHNKMTCTPLMEAVKLTHAVAEAIAQKDFGRAMEMRDPEFTALYDAFLHSTIYTFEKNESKVAPGAPAGEDGGLRVGIIHTGAPAGGMNAATRIAARLCLNRGHVPIGIRNGFSGLIKDEVFPFEWQHTVGWQVRGGSELGTNRDHPQPLPGGPKIAPKGDGGFVDLGLVAYHLQKHNIQALLIIGGFEAYTAQLTMTHARSTFPAFCIPMVMLPATVSNNVPGTDYSVGSDTALNVIVEACDRIKLSANASRNRVFVVEVQGGSCGYLATLGGLTTGATTVYIPEVGINISTLQEDIQLLCRRYTDEIRRGIPNEGRVILRSEMASSTYTTEVISKILRAEGNGLFDSRTAVLGHLQQGGVPSPLDRIRATRLAVNCITWLEAAARESRASNDNVNNTLPPVYTTRDTHSCTIGIVGAEIMFTPVVESYKDADVKTRRETKPAWWRPFTHLIKVLSKYEYRDDEFDADKVELLKNRDPAVKHAKAKKAAPPAPAPSS